MKLSLTSGKNPITGIPYISCLDLNIKSTVLNDYGYLKNSGLEESINGFDVALQEKQDLAFTVINYFLNKIQHLRNMPEFNNYSIDGKNIRNININEFLKACGKKNIEIFEVLVRNQSDTVSGLLATLNTDGKVSTVKPSPLPYSNNMRELIKYGNWLLGFVNFLETPLSGESEERRGHLIREYEKSLEMIKGIEHQQVNYDRMKEDLSFYRSPFYSENGMYYSDTLPGTLEKDKDVDMKVLEALKKIGRHSYFIKVV